jgi:hypothetical protein
VLKSSAPPAFGKAQPLLFQRTGNHVCQFEINFTESSALRARSLADSGAFDTFAMVIETPGNGPCVFPRPAGVLH